MNLERARRRRLGRAGRQGGGSSFVKLIERHGRWLLPALLAVVTLVAFLPMLENGFVWDDDANLVNNPDYGGLGWHQLRWMFTSFHLGHYIPLTWLTFALDYLVWGMDPAGYHLTNLVLHMTNTVIVYAIAVRLLAAALPTVGAGIAGRLGSAGAAVLFAVHPLRVESVAWATERRDVLCGLFYLLAVLVYLRVCAAGPTGQGLWRQRRYWVDLTRFRGHPIVGAERRVHDAEESSAVPTGISGAHHRAGPQGAEA